MASSKRQQVCMICLKRFSLSDNHTKDVEDKHKGLAAADGGGDNVGGEEVEEDNRREGCDLYSRFLHFANRYFKLTRSTEKFQNFARELRKEENGGVLEVKPFCDSCYELVTYICDLYGELQRVKLYLLWKLGEMGKLIKGSGRKVSGKLRKGLEVALTEQLNVKAIRQVVIFRKAVQLKCLNADKGYPPSIPIHRGLFPDEWKFTFSATKQALIRLIVVFILASSQVHSRETTHSSDNPADKLFDEEIPKRRRGRPTKSSEIALLPEDDDGNGPLDAFDNDSGSDWSGAAAAASPAMSPANSFHSDQEAEEDPTPRRGRGRPRGSKSKAKITTDPETEGPSKPKKRKGKRLKLTSTSKTKKTPTLTCPQCPRQFVDTRGLAQHLKQIHKTRNSYSCQKCGMVFKMKAQLGLHIMSSHHSLSTARGRRKPVEVTCKYCSKVFPSLTAMNRHRKLDKCGISRTLAYKDFLQKIQLEKRLDPASPPPPGKMWKWRSWTEDDYRKEKELAEQWIRDPCGLEECQERFDSAYLLRKHLEDFHEDGKEVHEKVIQCLHCWRKFCHRKSYDLHVRAEHQKKIYTGLKCDVESCEVEERFFTVEALNEHLKRHLEGMEVFGGSIFYCSHCNWGFSKEMSRDLHALEHVHVLKEGDKFKCPECPQVLDRSHKIKHHWNIAHGLNVKPHCCDICGKLFFGRQALNGHKRLHSKRAEDEKVKGVTDYTCVDCGLVCKDPRLLATHRKEHNVDNHVKCPEPGCGHVCRNKKVLFYHRKAKHGKGPQWICDQCGMKFVLRQGLVAHQKSHQEPSMVCNVCGEKFARKSTLDTHMDRKHNPDRDKRYVCIECGKSFFSDAGLKYHFDSTHRPKSEWKWECPNCSGKFYRKLLLRGHMKNCVKKGGGGGDAEGKVGHDATKETTSTAASSTSADNHHQNPWSPEATGSNLEGGAGGVLQTFPQMQFHQPFQFQQHNKQ